MKAYTAGGTRIGLVGMKPFATIPRHWRVRELRNANGWFRFIKDVKAEEKEQKDVHYEFIETAEGTRWKPTAIFFCWESPHSHMRAFDMDHISDYNLDYVRTSLRTIGRRSLDTMRRLKMEKRTLWSGPVVSHQDPQSKDRIGPSHPLKLDQMKKRRMLTATNAYVRTYVRTNQRLPANV